MRHAEVSILLFSPESMWLSQREIQRIRGLTTPRVSIFGIRMSIFKSCLEIILSIVRTVQSHTQTDYSARAISPLPHKIARGVTPRGYTLVPHLRVQQIHEGIALFIHSAHYLFILRRNVTRCTSILGRRHACGIVLSMVGC